MSVNSDLFKKMLVIGESIIKAHEYKMAYLAIQEALKDEDHNRLINASRGFFGATRNALLVALSIEISKLLDNNDESYSMWDLLKEVSNNFPNESQKIKTLKKVLSSRHDTLIQNLKTQRNKYYAHLDNEYLLQQRNLLQNIAPTDFSELSNALETIQKTFLEIKHMFVHLDTQTLTLNQEASYVFDLYLLLDAINKKQDDEVTP